MIHTLPEGQSREQMKTETRQITHLHHRDLKGQSTDLNTGEQVLPLLIWMDSARIRLGFGFQVVLQKLSGVVHGDRSLPRPSNLQTIDLYEAGGTEETVIDDLLDTGLITIK